MAGTYLDGFLFGMVLQLSVGPVCLAVFGRAAAGRAAAGAPRGEDQFWANSEPLQGSSGSGAHGTTAVAGVGLSHRAAAPGDALYEALWMVAGVALADALYIALAATGISGLFQTGAVRLALGLGGAVVLAWFGARMLLSRAPTRSETITAGPVLASSAGALPSLRYGFAITLTNPLTILFWGGVFAGLIAGGQIAGGAAWLFAAGCVSATLVFLTVVAVLGHLLGRTLPSDRWLVWFNRLVGAFLIAFAAKLALDVVRLM